jgi:hypothetical protein
MDESDACTEKNVKPTLLLPLVLVALTSGIGPAIGQGASEVALEVAAKADLDQMFDGLVTSLVQQTTSGQISMQSCGPQRWDAALASGLADLHPTFMPLWNQMNARILDQHVSAEALADASTLPAERIRGEIFGSIDPTALQVALDTDARPILAEAIAQLNQALSEVCNDNAQ